MHGENTSSHLASGVQHCGGGGMGSVRTQRKSSERAARPGRLAFAAALAAFAAGMLSPSEASAFCRSTTCRAKNGKECPTDQNGCPTDGAKLWWPTSCVSYATNKLGTQDLDPA